MRKTDEEDNCPVMPSYVDSKSWGISKSLGGNEDGVSWKTVLGGFKVFNMPMDCLIHILNCPVQGEAIVQELESCCWKWKFS